MSLRILLISLVTIGMTATFALGQNCPAPSTVAATANANGGVNSQWSAASGATGYDVQVTNVTTQIAQVISGVTTTSTSISNLQPGTSYTVKVAAKIGGCTTFFPAVTTTATAVTLPSPPTGISGIGGPNKVIISWTAAPSATSYQLTLSNGMSFTTTATTYTVTGLQTATSYNLIVASINASGRGGFSPAVVVRTANIAQ